MKKHVGKYTENGIGALVSGQGIAHGNNEANAMRGAAVRAVCYAGFAPPPGSPGQTARASRGGERKIFRGKV